jgi:hypothetical protein
MTTLRLTGEYISNDTIEVLRDILELAERGNIIGIAFITLHKRRGYSLGWAGQADKDPVITLGALHRLLAEVNDHAREIQS